jgi:nucleoside-diphosphate-sugar epimerase
LVPASCAGARAGAPGSLRVRDAYAGATVLLTGGSGYVGGVTLAALLRECPRVRRVYVLLRPRRGLDARVRLARVLSGPLFLELWCAAAASAWQSALVQRRVDSMWDPGRTL